MWAPGGHLASLAPMGSARRLWGKASGCLSSQRSSFPTVLQASHEQEKEALTHSFQEAKTALQETIDGLTSQLETFQAKMKRVEESILSRDYKKHIKVGGGTPGGLSFWNCQEGQGLGNKKGQSLLKDKAQA